MKRASLRGQMAVQCIRGFTATPRGRTYATGMGHQNPKEYRWKCPKGYTNEKLAHENFQMEFLSPDQDKNDLAVLQLHGGGYIGTLRNAYRRAALQYSICSGEEVSCHRITGSCRSIRFLRRLKTLSQPTGG